MTINPPKTNGEELTVEAKDEAGNPSQPNTVKADDSTPPAKPENLGVSDDGTRGVTFSGNGWNRAAP
ncbi:hypothetical protein INT80_14530 [Gallibacterium anatis]|uniref:Bacterial Ig domain-containing protein n=1 Tax=Gallibacterium anatis TaxID=750 RepID=A0A930UXB6_9PAST|nr:hypothetical protein [Gallibacterium anatis]